MDFVKKPNKRVLLNENDFRILVGGGIVQQDGVEIALQDIGWDRMEVAIDDARGNSGSAALTTEQLSNYSAFLGSIDMDNKGLLDF